MDKKDYKLLVRALEALDQEALASDGWKREAKDCAAWYRLRAEMRERLVEARLCDITPVLTDLKFWNFLVSV